MDADNEKDTMTMLMMLMMLTMLKMMADDRNELERPTMGGVGWGDEI